MISFANLPKLLEGKELPIREWIVEVLENHGRVLDQASVNFVEPVEMQEYNCRFLKHDYSTDILTFNYSEGPTLSFDIIICEEVVLEQAAFYGVEESEELLRVIIHGVLHCIGFDDSTEGELKKMRAAEDAALNLQRVLN